MPTRSGKTPVSSARPAASRPRRRWRLALLTALAFLSLASYVLAGGSGVVVDSVPERWEPFRPMLGVWSSSKSGAAGTGIGQRIYELVIGGRYLLHRNASVFPPQEGNPDGEFHEDWALLSYDGNRDTYVMRQFNIEGFVNRYVLEEHDVEAGRLVWVTEAVENGPPGLRARITIVFEGSDHFEETFELAMPDGEFREIQRNRLTRVRPEG